MRRFLLLILLLPAYSIAATAKNENYLPYYDLVNAAEDSFVVAHHPAASLDIYERAFHSVQRPFIKDYFIAAEIACYSDDTSRMLGYLTHCFEQGMPLACLHEAKVFDGVVQQPQLMARLADLSRKVVQMPIDSSIRDSTYRRYYSEQILKRDQQQRAAFQADEQANTAYFDKLLARGIFPSEQLIGMFTEEGIGAFITGKGWLPIHKAGPPLGSTSAGVTITGIIPDDYELWNGAAFYSYIHYPCGFVHSRQAFWSAVISGYVHPKDYCMLEEWAAAGASNPTFLQDCAADTAHVFYNINSKFFSDKPEDLALVDQHRAERHVQPFAVDMQKMKMQQQTGIVFFFGFFNWR